MRFSDRAAARLASTVVKHAENDRNEHQRCDGCTDQAADHGAAERRVLFAAFAEPERHRRHADDHGERRHQHRTEADEAGFERRRDRVAAFARAARGQN